MRHPIQNATCLMLRGERIYVWLWGISDGCPTAAAQGSEAAEAHKAEHEAQRQVRH